MIGKSDQGDRDASDVVSIVGPGMTVEGDCSTEGTVRVEGRVEGTIRAAKAVVVGEDAEVVGDIRTQDAVVAGRVEGTIVAESRLELKASSRVEGDIHCRRVTLEEGGYVEGRLAMGETGPSREEARSPQPSPSAAAGEGAEG